LAQYWVKDISRQKPNLKNRIAPELEKKVVDLTFDTILQLGGMFSLFPPPVGIIIPVPAKPPRATPSLTT
jgi:hypothetical protein